MQTVKKLFSRLHRHKKLSDTANTKTNLEKSSLTKEQNPAESSATNTTTTNVVETVESTKLDNFKVKRKVLLVILDGFGEAPEPDPRPSGNAIALANTPNFDKLKSTHPYSLLEACGEAVGLVAGGMGGSEIGHFAIGAGRVVPQTLLQINWSIADRSFFKNPALSRGFNRATKKNELVDPEHVRSLHLLGMISDAGVHSHTDHLFALLQWVKAANLKSCFLHCIGDGRDVESQSIMKYLKMIEQRIEMLDLGETVKFGTIIGRFYALDRDNNWDRTRVSYDLLVQGKGELLEKNDLFHIEEKINEFYSSKAKDTSDYSIPPIVCDPEAAVHDHDAVIFFNYRTDRPRQLTEVFERKEFAEFPRTHIFDTVLFLTMGPYSTLDTQDKPNADKDNVIVGYPTPVVNNNMGEWLSKKGIKQMRIAETEKYAHVTYFFNSQKEDKYEGEDRILVPSKKCYNFAEIPEMSAFEITEEVVNCLDKNEHDLIVVNYANADLVGHTGKMKETITAIETLDQCVERIHEASQKNDYVFVLTGDHGNAEDMLYDDGSQKVSHSMNKVIFMVGDKNLEDGKLKLKDGGLADVAPTVLEIMGVEQPKDMTGKSLIVH